MKNNTRLQDIPVAQKINAGVEGSPRSPRTRFSFLNCRPLRTPPSPPGVPSLGLTRL